MPKVQRFINVSGCTFTGLAIPNVSQLVIEPRARAVGFEGGLDVFPRAKRVTFADPRVVIDAVEDAGLDGVEVGSTGALVFTVNDAAKGAAAGGGARIATVANAVYLGPGRKATHRKRHTRCLCFETFSPDGQTDPVQWVNA